MNATNDASSNRARSSVYRPAALAYKAAIRILAANQVARAKLTENLRRPARAEPATALTNATAWHFSWDG
jgi:hypothetical protein